MKRQTAMGKKDAYKGIACRLYKGLHISKKKADNPTGKKDICLSVCLSTIFSPFTKGNIKKAYRHLKMPSLPLVIREIPI